MTSPAGGAAKPSVVYWNNMPAPYIVERLNSVAERGIVDLEVWFNERKGGGRSWAVDESKWKFQYRYLKSFQIGKRRFLVPPILHRRSKPDIIVSLYSTPEFIVGWFVARLRGCKTMFRVLKTFDSWVRRSALKERVKRFLFSRVDGVETTGPDGAAYAKRYGTPVERIYVLPHVFDVDAFIEGSRRARAGRDSARSSLGLEGTTFVYVGRLWRKKGVGDLIDAFLIVQRSTPTAVSLLIVGDGPDEAELRLHAKAAGLANVVFAGFRGSDELPGLFAASDVFVFPTWGDPYGLVVDEAMASALPVISTDSAGEIRERIIDGENGFVVPTQEIQAMADAMAKLSQNGELRQLMGSNSQKRIASHMPPLWAAGFEQAISNVLRQ